MSDTFLPEAYQVPKSTSGYMSLEQGANRFRALSSPILGNEIWVNDKGEARSKEDKPQKGDKPIRTRMGVDTPVGAQVKHFWSLVVYNYATKSIQILNITQSTIQDAIRAYTLDPDWGNPKGVDGYDFVIGKTGELLETKYTVTTKIPKKLDKAIMDKYESMGINLEVTFDGIDPLAKKEEGK